VEVSQSKPVTQLLEELRQGDTRAHSKLVALVYPELRRIAAGYMKRERKNHTLQATALVNEAYLRLAGCRSWEDRAHFFAAAAHIMRQILVDYARQWSAEKRGGGALRVTLHEWMAVGEKDSCLVLEVDRLLKRLEQLDPRQCQIVELRFFSGMTEEEISDVLGISLRTVKRDWAMARAWLQKQQSELPQE
jgi:RNA polymerase sigma-70 factor (ECF subfamily)